MFVLGNKGKRTIFRKCKKNLIWVSCEEKISIFKVEIMRRPKDNLIGLYYCMFSIL